MMDFSSGFSVNTSTKQNSTQVSHSQAGDNSGPEVFFSTRLKAHKHLVLHEGTASISHSPSGSNSLVTPSCCSATLKAFWRLWVGLDLFRLLYSTRSGLRKKDGESKDAKKKNDNETETGMENEAEKHWADGFHACLHCRAGESGFDHSSLLTGVCVWERWRPCRPSSWWWSSWCWHWDTCKTKAGGCHWLNTVA